MTNENLKIAWEKTLKFLTALSKIGIVIIAVATGFASGNLYVKYKEHTSVKDVIKTRDCSTVSVAMNEKGELMIVNTSNGTYEVYSDSIGKMIFDLYASRLYYKTKTE